MKKTIVVDLYGGPGSGKSSGASFIFSYLKMRGVLCELVTEFAKDLVWDEASPILKDQFFITASQWHRVHRLLGKVDYVITDSPIILGLEYGKELPYYREFSEMVTAVHNSVESIEVFVKRDKPYVAAGRLQTEEEAVKKDESIKEILKVLSKNELYTIYGNEDGYSYLANELLLKLKED